MELPTLQQTPHLLGLGLLSSQSQPTESSPSQEVGRNPGAGSSYNRQPTTCVTGGDIDARRTQD